MYCENNFQYGCVQINEQKKMNWNDNEDVDEKMFRCFACYVEELRMNSCHRSSICDGKSFKHTAMQAHTHTDTPEHLIHGCRIGVPICVCVWVWRHSMAGLRDIFYRFVNSRARTNIQIEWLLSIKKCKILTVRCGIRANSVDIKARTSIDQYDKRFENNERK